MVPKAEYDLYQRFNEMVQGKTAVYISHRLSSAKFCDVIAVFSNGQIIEYESYDDLNTRYQNMYRPDRSCRIND